MLVQVQSNPYFAEKLSWVSQDLGRPIGFEVVESMLADPLSVVYPEGTQGGRFTVQRQRLGKFVGSGGVAKMKPGQSWVLESTQCPELVVILKKQGDGSVKLGTAFLNSVTVKPGHPAWPFMAARKVIFAQKRKSELARAQAKSLGVEFAASRLESAEFEATKVMKLAAEHGLMPEFRAALQVLVKRQADFEGR